MALRIPWLGDETILARKYNNDAVLLEFITRKTNFKDPKRIHL